MKDYIHKQFDITVKASQFDGVHLIEGMDIDMGGAFIKTATNILVYVNTSDFVVKSPTTGYLFVAPEDKFNDTYESF